MNCMASDFFILMNQSSNLIGRILNVCCYLLCMIPQDADHEQMNVRTVLSQTTTTTTTATIFSSSS